MIDSYYGVVLGLASQLNDGSRVTNSDPLSALVRRAENQQSWLEPATRRDVEKGGAWPFQSTLAVRYREQHTEPWL